MSSDSPIKPIIKSNKHISAWIMAGVCLPWIWAVYFLPWWISAVASVCAIGIYLVLVSKLTQLTAPQTQPVFAQRRATDDSAVSDRRIEKFRGTDGLSALVERWSILSHSIHSSVQTVDQEISHVMNHTEQAALDIGNTFQAILSKMATQMEHALELLKTTRNPNLKGMDGKELPDSSESLTDFTTAYEKLFDRMSDKLIHFSNRSLDLVMGQKIAQESIESIDGFLDEIANISRQGSTLALRTSVEAGGVSANERAFTEMADRMRESSRKASEFSRNIRTHIQGMRADIRAVDESMSSMATELKEVARHTRDEVNKLAREMLSKNQEVTESVENINNLGHELKQDIHKIIMSLQFQDITQQKLQRLKDPMLQEIGQRLDSMVKETRVLGKKLQPPVSSASH